MKSKNRKNKWLWVVCAYLFAAITFCACSSDNDFEYNKTYVKYKLTLGSNFQSFYDITVTYLDMEGNKITENLSNIDIDSKSLRAVWSYKDEKEGDHDIIFGFRAVAKVKNIPTSFDKSATRTYDLSHGASVSWYTKTTGAKVYAPQDKQIDPLRLDTTQLRSYLNSHLEIELIQYPQDEDNN